MKACFSAVGIRVLIHIRWNWEEDFLYLSALSVIIPILTTRAFIVRPFHSSSPSFHTKARVVIQFDRVTPLSETLRWFPVSLTQTDLALVSSLIWCPLFFAYQSPASLSFKFLKLFS